eukprot:48612-Heterocapsa_arctica.AAC.1
MCVSTQPGPALSGLQCDMRRHVWVCNDSLTTCRTIRCLRPHTQYVCPRAITRTSFYCSDDFGGHTQYVCAYATEPPRVWSAMRHASSHLRAHDLLTTCLLQ